MSYNNIRMYSAVIPSYDTDDDEDGKGDVINADDPANRALLEREMFG